MPSLPLARFRSLDAVRALAAVSVLVTHWSGWFLTPPDDALSWLAARWNELFAAVFWAARGIHPGVVVFIVLSGFCIHLPQARRTSALPDRSFWKTYARRRALRILPVYWVGVVLGALALIVVTAMGVASASPFADTSWSPGDLTARLLLANGVRPGPDLGNGPLDTVAAEAVLYCVYPVLLALRRRWGWKSVFAMSALLQGIAVLALRSGWEPRWIGASALTFHLYWAMGALAAERFCRADPARHARPWSVLVFGFYLVVAHVVRVRGAHLVATAVLGLAAAFALYELMVLERTRQAGAPMKALAWIGERSYSLYAIHAPLLVVTWVLLATAGLPPSLARPALLVAVLAGTLLTYACVESPSHRWAKGPMRSEASTPLNGEAAGAPRLR
ncbi:MAG: acyltransferase [Anaeromyxobacter sp.]